MSQPESSSHTLRRDHPVFFWGIVLVIVLLLSATGLVASRIPMYRRDAAEVDQRMNREEREARDQILRSRTNREELALALLQREMRLKALQEKGLHLAISLSDSTLSLRHGAATLRQIRVRIGSDSTVHAPDGRTWRFVRALGERHVEDKDVDATDTIPEWVYAARGQAAPPPSDRALEGGSGHYRLRLDDGTEIYSRPSVGPLAEGVMPGAFLVEDEHDFQTIFDAVTPDTPVYIY